MILTSRFFLKVVGSSIIRMGHHGDLGGEPLLAPPAPEWSLGNELNQEWRWIFLVVLSRVPCSPGGLLCSPASLGSPSTTFCANHYPPLDVTGLLCVPDIMLTQSTHLRKRILGKLRKLGFRKDKSLSQNSIANKWFYWFQILVSRIFWKMME